MDEKLNQNNLNHKRIAVIGIGGVGGYMAGMLGKAYRHVTLAARGERLRSLREKGLVLHSDLNGEMTVFPEHVVPVKKIGVQDYIFVCVKNYSLEEVCHAFKEAVTDETVIVPVMNGVDPGDKIRRILKKGIVVDSLIYIVAFANPDYSITQQGNSVLLKIGIQNADESQWQSVEAVSALLDGAGINYRNTRDIETEIWRKYILNCAYNVATAYYESSIGLIRSDVVKTKKYEALVQEAYQVALAKGVDVKQEHIDKILREFYGYKENATSSLQRDVSAGRQAELDTFSGYLVREARKLGISVPVSEEMYEGLKERVGK